MFPLQFKWQEKDCGDNKIKQRQKNESGENKIKRLTRKKLERRQKTKVATTI